jgi:uncharacterized protein (TIGR01244 family)
MAGAVALAPALALAAKEPQTYGIANATFPLPGVMAAGQPTGEQIQLLAEEGYRTVIDLRAPDEPRGFDEPEAAKQSGLAYINIPVTPATLDQTTIDRFFNALRKAERPVLLHCGSSSRVGGLLYAWLVLERREEPRKALEQARAAGLSHPEMIEQVRKLVAERQAPSPRP